MFFQFLNTIEQIKNNEHCNTVHGIAEHILWQFRKLSNDFPTVLNFERFKICIRDKSIANGPGGLLNSMGYFDPNNMRFIETNKEKEILAELNDNGQFLGPFKINYKKRELSSSFENHEDWIYLNQDFKTDIERAGYKIG